MGINIGQAQYQNEGAAFSGAAMAGLKQAMSAKKPTENPAAATGAPAGKPAAGQVDKPTIYNAPIASEPFKREQYDPVTAGGLDLSEQEGLSAPKSYEDEWKDLPDPKAEAPSVAGFESKETEFDW